MDDQHAITGRMTLSERSDLVLAFARVLYVNGQSTDQTLAAYASIDARARRMVERR